MKRRDFLQISAALPLLTCAQAVQAQPPFWNRVFAQMPKAYADMASNPEYRVQILCQFRRSGTSHWHSRHWQLQPRRWFSIGSVAKLPMALLACEQVAAMGGTLQSTIGFSQTPIGGEWPGSEPEFENLERGLVRTFTVSENVPFNRWYDFLGVDAIAARLTALGYPSARLISRMSAPVRDNAHTRAGRVYAADGKVLADFPERFGRKRRFDLGDARTGKGFLHDDGRLLEGPHDFSNANFIALADAHRMLRALIDPESVPQSQRWAIPEEMRQALLPIMAMMPRDSTDPVYPETAFYDGYARFFLIGDSHERKPDALQLTGKVGEAYGFLSDVEYIRAQDSPMECLLSANLYVNADGIFNDDIYEYETLGYPFLAALGKAVWYVVNAEA